MMHKSSLKQNPQKSVSFESQSKYCYLESLIPLEM